MKQNDGGYTLVELIVSFTVLIVITLGFFALYISLLHSAAVAKHKAVATTLATNQLEYLKSLPYNNLAVIGGPIPGGTITGTITKKVNGETYTIVTNISYADDAYDGCGSYPTQALKQTYCRSYPPPSGAPATDSNPADYKDVNVTVSFAGSKLSSLDSDIAALVAETSSNTGAIFVKVVDSGGNPVVGATVNAVDSTVSPVVNVTDTTDENGIVIFYDMTPDNGADYVITASENGYSSLSTIAASGTLVPTYANQKLIAQSSSIVTLTINPMGTNSLLLESTDLSGNPLGNAKIYIKGGYKKYTLTSNTAYYFDNLTPSDSRPVTDSGGLAGVTNLVPGPYILCGDTGSTSCSVGATSYYLAAAVPYGGNSALAPITVPSFAASNPTYAYNGNNYQQKVRLMLTTNSSFPRVNTLSPSTASLADGLSNFAFSLTGVNLPCSSTASSCSTHVNFLQGSSNFAASCTGNASGLQLSCTVNLTTATAGNTQLVVNVGSNTLTLPSSPLLGGILVTN